MYSIRRQLKIEIKQRLLHDILNSKGVFYHKYTNSYHAMRNILDLEFKEDKEVNKKIKPIFDKITNKYVDFYKGISLTIMEQFFMRNNKDLGRFIPIEFNDEDYGEISAMNLYVMLEDFFNEIFNLAVMVANLYSYEIKFNEISKNANNSEDVL